MNTLKLIGKLRTRHAGEVSASPLCVGFETLDRKMFTPAKCYDAVAGLGVKMARLQTGWNRCETVKGQYDFSWLDESVDELLSRGVRPWFNLGYGNILYMQNAPHPCAVGCIPHGYGDESVSGWEKFVFALVKHFAGRVSEFEIWNEPNIPCFWHPLKCSGKEYARLIEYTAPVIGEANPDAKIGGCSATIACAFIYEVMQTGVGKHLDFFSVHPYSPVPEQNYADNVESLKNIFAKFAPHVELWQGECGYPAQAHGHHDEWMNLDRGNETIQAHYVARRIVLDSMSGFKRISYFHICDLMESTYRQADGSVRPPVMLGLLHGKDYTPRKSWSVLRNLASIFDAECTVAPLWMNLHIKDYSGFKSGAWPLVSPITAKFIRRGYPLYAWYLPEELQKEWPGIDGVRLSGMIETPKALCSPVLIDVMSGNVFEPSDVFFTDYEFHDRGEEIDAVDLTGNAFMIRNLPMYDYPLLVTDRDAIDMQI